MAPPHAPYYRPDLALVHHLGFGFHADACAPGILALLEPVRARHGLVLEVGCGSGLLTRHLIDAGHRVVATDGSPAMVELARRYAIGAEDVRVLVLPDDPLPPADAVVSVGHVVNYVGDRDAVERAIVAIAGAVRPDGLLAIDVCDLEWAAVRQGAPGAGKIGEDWAIAVEFSIPAPDRFVRDIARSSATTTAPGGAATSATKTCCSTRRGSPTCCGRTGSRSPSARPSVRRPFRPVCAP